MRLRSLIAASFVLTNATWMFPQQPDCKKLESTNERAQCLAKQLVDTESEMNRALAQAISAHSPGNNAETDLPKSRGTDSAILNKEERLTVKALRDSQSKWRDFRESACTAVEHMYAGGTITAEAVPACKLELTRQRTAWLNSYFHQND